MLNTIRQMFSKSQPALSEEARGLIMALAASGIWVLAIGVRGTPTMPSMGGPETFPAALQALAAHRKELSELGDDDSLFPFNYKREGRQIMPFFSSEERARAYLVNSGFAVRLSVFQPYPLQAGFIAAPHNDKFDLVLDPRSPSERTLEDAERMLLRSLSPAGHTA